MGMKLLAGAGLKGPAAREGTEPWSGPGGRPCAVCGASACPPRRPPRRLRRDPGGRGCKLGPGAFLGKRIV